MISLIFAGGLYITTGGITTAFALLGTPVIMMSGIVIIFKPLIYSTKRKRAKTKIILNDNIEKLNKELSEIKEKINNFKEKIEYSEMDLYEEEIVPVTTVENKKVNVKMRVLKLEQSR